MKERGILFGAPMVRALLAGTKSQTRRLMKPQLEPATRAVPFAHRDDWTWRTSPVSELVTSNPSKSETILKACPYGVPGDRLWVRETHAQFAVGEGMSRSVPQCVAYRATCDADGGFDYVNGRGEAMRIKVTKWTPAIHMPRWASRLTLEVTDVRVQRLQSISEEDAIAEGARCWVCDGPIDGTSENDCACFHSRAAARDSFQALWDSINGARAPWVSNPWVWAVSFKRVEEP